jgi:hypothetical protein
MKPFAYEIDVTGSVVKGPVAATAERYLAAVALVHASLFTTNHLCI